MTIFLKCVFTNKCLPTCRLKYIFVLPLKKRNGEKKEEKKRKEVKGLQHKFLKYIEYVNGNDTY